MFATTLTAEQRLEKGVVKIMSHKRYAALAGVMMIGDRQVCDNTPTAKTNGRDEWYGRQFIEGLTDPELRFLILHECYHKLYRHLTTWKALFNINPDLANRACDYVINLKIMEENSDNFAVMPEGGCLDNKYIGMNALQVFNDLRDGDDQKDKDGAQGEGGGQGEPLDEHDWEGAQELGAEEQKQLSRDIDQAIRQGALSAGKMGADVERLLGDLLQPQIDWREVLRDFINNTCAGRDYSTYARPNRRFIGMGHYLPSGISEEVGELVIGIDTSYSISDHEINMFLSEVVSICETVNPERVRLLYWGSNVVNDEEYDHDRLSDIASSTNPRGGGGTDVRCMVDYIRDKDINAQAAIVLTDGELYSGWGEWNIPVLWVVKNDHDKNMIAPVGKTVHISSNH